MADGSRPRVVLLNPPGRRVYLRDYYCSKASQADYLNAPIDLLYAGGWLRGRARLTLLDAIVSKLGPEACLAALRRAAPQAVVGLIGSASLAEDLDFYGRLAEAAPAALILSGDLLQEDRRRRLAALPFAAALLHDFTSPALARYLDGCREADRLPGLTFRDSAGAVRSGPPHAGPGFRVPRPAHELFLDLPYRYPFVRRARFATVLTDFGCPYRCEFCVMPSLGWKARPAGDVVEELAGLRERRVSEVFFLDQTFGLRRRRARRLLTALRRMGFGWVCFNRPDLLDPGWARELADGGCHTMILGLESGSERILQAARKDYGREQILRGFRLCRQAGIRTVATVIAGLPEETEETFRETLRFLDEVRPDFASFNVAVPRIGTPLRRRALELGLIDGGLEEMDQSGSPVAMGTLALSRRQVAALSRGAARRFYANPGYLLRRLRALAAGGTAHEWASHFRQGLAIGLRQ